MFELTPSTILIPASFCQFNTCAVGVAVGLGVIAGSEIIVPFGVTVMFMFGVGLGTGGSKHPNSSNDEKTINKRKNFISLTPIF